MSWTYDAEDMTIPLNRVRLMVGDTNASDPQLSDEELQLFIDSSDTDRGAAVLAARALAAKYARSVDKWVGDLKILASQRHRAYQALVEELTPTGGSINGIPSAGGIRYSSKEEILADTDLVVPSFYRGVHDNVDDV